MLLAPGIIATRGHEIVVASTDTLIQDEITMEPFRITKTIDQIKEPEFDALMFISGHLANVEVYWQDKLVLGLVDEFNTHDKPLAAICTTVPILRFAAKGKRVSFFPLLRSKQLLSAAGAVLQPVSLSVDYNLVTAEYQMVAEVWANEFCNLLEGKPRESFFEDSGFTPGRRERKPIPEVERLKAQKLTNRGG